MHNLKVWLELEWEESSLHVVPLTTKAEYHRIGL